MTGLYKQAYLYNGGQFMSFSQSMGIVPAKEIQINSVDRVLRNRLYNVIDDWRKKHNTNFHSVKYNDMYKFAIDKLGIISNEYRNPYWIDNILRFELCRDINFGPEWYHIYDILEYFMDVQKKECDLCSRNPCKGIINCGTNKFLNSLPIELNQVLEEEKSAYRMVNGKFVQITSEIELESIKGTIASPFASVSAHMEKALALYSDREKPDYENSIKESISAVEAMCCIITGLDGRNATLGYAIEKLEASGVKIHTELKDAYKKLYAYTNQATGIRHGGIDFTDVSAEDAKYMLVSCSSFVNYLIEKYSKAKKATDNQDE
jgi:hypothetical protein